MLFLTPCAKKILSLKIGPNPNNPFGVFNTTVSTAGTQHLFPLPDIFVSHQPLWQAKFHDAQTFVLESTSSASTNIHVGFWPQTPTIYSAVLPLSPLGLFAVQAISKRNLLLILQPIKRHLIQ